MLCYMSGLYNTPYLTFELYCIHTVTCFMPLCSKGYMNCKYILILILAFDSKGEMKLNVKIIICNTFQINHLRSLNMVSVYREH
jgi:hypothetical protein